MISQPAVVFCLMDSYECPLRKIMVRALEEYNGSHNGSQRGDDDSSLV